MQTYVNLVNPVKSCLTSIWLQKSAWIQPRTNLSEFEGDSIYFFKLLLDQARSGPGLTVSPGTLLLRAEERDRSAGALRPCSSGGQRRGGAGTRPLWYT